MLDEIISVYGKDVISKKTNVPVAQTSWSDLDHSQSLGYPKFSLKDKTFALRDDLGWLLLMIAYDQVF